MRKYLVTLAAVLALGGAAAHDLPFQGEFTLVSNGAVVGTGELEEGKLTLKLPEGTAGFDATLTIMGVDGVPVEYEVSVGADGSILIWDSLVDLNRVVSESGGEVEIEFEPGVAEQEADAAEDAADAAENAEEAAQEAAERMAEDAEEAAERAAEEAEEAAERAAEEAADAADRVAEEAEEAAERAAEEAEEAAERAAEEAERAAEERGDAAGDDEDEDDEDNDDKDDDEDEDE